MRAFLMVLMNYCSLNYSFFFTFLGKNIAENNFVAEEKCHCQWIPPITSRRGLEDNLFARANVIQ